MNKKIQSIFIEISFDLKRLMQLQKQNFVIHDNDICVKYEMLS